MRWLPESPPADPDALDSPEAVIAAFAALAEAPLPAIEPPTMPTSGYYGLAVHRAMQRAYKREHPALYAAARDVERQEAIAAREQGRPQSFRILHARAMLPVLAARRWLAEHGHPPAAELGTTGAYADDPPAVPAVPAVDVEVDPPAFATRSAGERVYSDAEYANDVAAIRAIRGARIGARVPYDDPTTGAAFVAKVVRRDGRPHPERSPADLAARRQHEARLDELIAHADDPPPF